MKRRRPHETGVDAAPADDVELPPSKSQRKRDHAALQRLGDELAALPAARFAALALDERTREEIARVRRMDASGARQRQLRLIAQLLEDEDIDALRRATDDDRAGHAARVRSEQAADALRRDFIAQGEPALSAAGLDPDAATREQLLAARATALQHHDEARARGAARAIYRLLLQALDARAIGQP